MFLVRSGCCIQQHLRRQLQPVCIGNLRATFFSTKSTEEDISILKNADHSSPPPPPPSSSSDPLAGIYSQADVPQPLEHLSAFPPLELTNINTSITPVREVWVENMSTPHSIKLAILPLHPDVWSAFPRPDFIQENHKWQTLYKHVDWRWMPTRAEIKGTTRKPWPQKGMGRARHGDRKAPQFKGGGWACGPRGPRTYFYMLPWHKRFAQNDVHVVDSFASFPLEGTTAHLEELCEARAWGPSVLFVDRVPIERAPLATVDGAHLFEATKGVTHINVLPVYGLNVFSMLKHETLVLTVEALREIEAKLLHQLRRVDLKNVIGQSQPYGISRM
ncbi:54S ribosomal protein L4 mitochondrial [Tyrophagus putrescentiae]|nr:54S ribosomal protein L4 mitochondrial [Tyrophagus putrescentiae]